MSDDREPVVVATAPDGVIGSIMAAALESAGITVLVRSAAGGWLFPGVQTSAGPVEILVPGALAADARAILTAEEDAAAGPDTGR